VRVSDLKNYIEIQVPYKYVMNSFHTQTPDDTCAVLLGSDGVRDRNVARYEFQFLVRSSDPELAEDIAYKIHGHFNNKTDYVIGQTRVTFSRGQQTVPLYTGVDEGSRHIYSVNITAVADS
jgi:Bacteriophage minor capsid protein